MYIVYVRTYDNEHVPLSGYYYYAMIVRKGHARGLLVWW